MRSTNDRKAGTRVPAFWHPAGHDGQAACRSAGAELLLRRANADSSFTPTGRMSAGA
jgi:hypothetical protein